MGFSAGTKVLLNNSSFCTFEELTRRKMKNIAKGFAIDRREQVSVQCDLVVPRVIHDHSPMMTVRFANGDEVDCTPDQEFYLEELRTVYAKDLKPGDALLGEVDGSLGAVFVVQAILNLRPSEVAYAVTVPKYANFALACGVYAKA